MHKAKIVETQSGQLQESPVCMGCTEDSFESHASVIVVKQVLRKCDGYAFDPRCEFEEETSSLAVIPMLDTETQCGNA
jgi:hypothetical protein